MRRLFIVVALVASAFVQAHAEEAESAQAVGQLKTVKVKAKADDATENTGSFAAKKSRTSSRLDMDLKETPQSISVITREQMDQRGLSNIEDILNATPGVYTTRLDSERSAYYARGFAITNRQIEVRPVKTLNLATSQITY